MRPWMRWFAVFTLALGSASVMSHEMSMAEMELRETRPGEFLWQWTASGSKPAGDELTPVWPDACAAEGNLLRCGEAGLRGEMSVDGVGERYSAALVKVYWRDGQNRVFTITERQPTIHLYGSAEDERGMGEIAGAYLVLGVEHILGGIDHLLFVVTLLFLVGFTRKLLWTITAFTLAHSLTLVSAALGWLTLPSAPVEATIALSILLVAGEALNKNESLAKRLPALVAFLFGLIHGLGFAGALSEIGLPQNHLAVALFTFNVGVELGQLFAVLVAWAAWRLSRNWPAAQWVRVPLLYGIGGLAAYWSFDRIASIVA